MCIRDSYESPGQSDFVLRVGLCDGDRLRWLPEETIDAGETPSAENWRALEYDLADYAGKTLGVVVEVSAGGPKGWLTNEECFFDEISVVMGSPGTRQGAEDAH